LFNIIDILKICRIDLVGIESTGRKVSSRSPPLSRERLTAVVVSKK
jgi:hypothetical protein